MRKNLTRLETLAWAGGLLCLGVLLAIFAEAHRAGQAAAHFGHPASVHAQTQTGSAKGAPVPEKAPVRQDFATYQGVIGRLEMPELGLRVPILNDYDPNSLRQGVGRIRGTGVPGGLGNFAVAGHRDTYFRPLRRVRKGMVMHVVVESGSFDYVVDSTEIVLPENVDVLDIGDRPEMTLITCYPFDFIGAAPKRFIVRGHLLSVAAHD